jgi:hypothetical protein
VEGLGSCIWSWSGPSTRLEERGSVIYRRIRGIVTYTRRLNSWSNVLATFLNSESKKPNRRCVPVEPIRIHSKSTPSYEYLSNDSSWAVRTSATVSVIAAAATYRLASPRHIVIHHLPPSFLRGERKHDRFSTMKFGVLPVWCLSASIALGCFCDLVPIQYVIGVKC